MSGTLDGSQGGTVVVTLSGELDAHDAPGLRELFASAHERAQADDVSVLLDLTQVTFLDSTVLGSIVGLLRRVREAGGSAAWCCGGGARVVASRSPAWIRS